MDSIFIKSHGKLYIESGNLVFIDINKKKTVIPIKNIKDIHILGKVSLTSGAIRTLLINRIPVHFYSKNSYYIGSLFPRGFSGRIIVKQVEKYNDYNLRLYISKQIIEACKVNFYEIFRRKTEEAKKFLEVTVYDALNVNQVMGKESQIFLIAYELFDKISKFKIVERTRRPPKNEANALLSFLNSLLYGLILTEIYKKGLLPTISYLHEPSDDRPSLALDIAEIFKPIFSFRLMLRLFNLGILNENHFMKEKDGVYLNDIGKEIVLNEIIKYLDKKIRIKEVGSRTLKFSIGYQVKKLKEFIEDKSSILRTVKVF